MSGGKGIYGVIPGVNREPNLGKANVNIVVVTDTDGHHSGDRTSKVQRQYIPSVVSRTDSFEEYIWELKGSQGGDEMLGPASRSTSNVDELLKDLDSALQLEDLHIRPVAYAEHNSPTPRPDGVVGRNERWFFHHADLVYDSVRGSIIRRHI
jgi:hypothetical protein